MKKVLSAYLAIVAIVAVSCRGTEPEAVPAHDGPQPGEYSLPIIETTDMHGHMVETDNSGVHYRLAYIADKVEDYRQAGKDRLLLIDGGDLYQGASVSNLMSGWPMYVSMHRMGYDAAALGNHEFDWGFENMVDPDATLPDYEWEGSSIVNDVPVVCANLYQNGSRVPATMDYVIVEKSATDAHGNVVPVRIGIVGFAVEYSGSIITTQFIGKGYSIKEDYAAVNGIARELEASGQCDATILLVHGMADEVAGNLGKDSPFDLVAGGHSHQTKSGRTAWGLAYIQGGRYCEHYAFADLWFTVDDSGKVTFRSADKLSGWIVNSSRDLHSFPGQNASDLSEDILAVSDYALAATAAVQNEVIGHIKVSATSYPISGSGERATVMGNWMCDIIRRIGSADVAFVNAGGVRITMPLNGQPSRDITAANVYEIFPFNNVTYVYNLTYADLLQVFEYSMTSGGGALFTYMTGIDCRFVEYDHGTYSTYEVCSLDKDGTTIYQNGKWTGDWADLSVTLAVSEYLATTERTDYYTGIANPLLGWNSTSRLVSSTLVDNENAIRVLRAEASSSGGLLYIDTKPHFILVAQ